MKSFLRKIPDSLLRVIFVFAVFITVVLTVRFFLPASLKDTSIHRQSTVERVIATPAKYAGTTVCEDCHEEYALKKKGYHRNLSCETCHGPSKAHTESPSETKPIVPRMRDFCTSCHAYNPSRPTGFPQINPAVHNPLKQCITCHNPHDPKPPSTHRECEGCHAQIARTKALSPHVQLECITCHTINEEHKVAPRANTASKPSERSFCGKCHAKESTVTETLKIDIASHGEKYLCWQCHYPHMPEVE